MAHYDKSTVTVNGETYTVIDSWSAGSAGTKFFGKFVFILRKSDGTEWRALGKRVAHNSVLIPHNKG